MAIALSTLIKKVSHLDITLIAGQNGISNLVSWVHMVETTEACTFLEGREFAFTTGVGLNANLSIFDLVENIWKNNAAGIALNIGPFIDTIPQEVIDFGNAHDFPIFTVPWKTHIAEVMRIFSYMITKSEQANFAIAAAFKNAISFPKQEELYVVPLSQYNFNIHWNYYACVTHITLLNQQPISQERLESLCLNIDTHLRHYKYTNFAVLYNEHLLIAITGNYSEESMQAFIHELHEYLSLYLAKNEEFFISIGKSTKSLRCLYKSYNQALSMQNLKGIENSTSNILSYSNMGIYKLLLGIEDKDIMEEYYENTILPLIEYDQKNHSDLADVLWTYLKHDGSVKDTADELYVHRNTINYKLGRAAEILGLNLSSLDVRLQLTLGFMLRNML